VHLALVMQAVQAAEAAVSMWHLGLEVLVLAGKAMLVEQVLMVHLLLVVVAGQVL
jgi:hypothetical protein